MLLIRKRPLFIDAVHELREKLRLAVEQLSGKSGSLGG
jgi:hypothetical protein